MKMTLDKQGDNPDRELAEEAGKKYTSLLTMRAALEAAKEAERQANPALAAAEEAAKEIAAAKKEAAERLPDEERNEIKEGMSNVFKIGMETDQQVIQDYLATFKDEVDAAKSAINKLAATGKGSDDET